MTPEEFLKKHHYELGTPTIKQYLKIKSENLDGILLFQIGDFFEMFFEDAILAHKALGIYLTYKGLHNNDKIPMSGIPIHSYKRYVAQLIKKGYTVFICEQMESADITKKKFGYKAIVERSITQVITPGTIIDHEMLESQDNNFLLSIVKDNNQYGISYIDISTGEFQTLKSDNAINEIYKINPSEIITTIDIAHEFQSVKIKTTKYPEHMILNHNHNMKKFIDAFQLESIDAFTFDKIELQSIILILSYLRIIKVSTKNILYPKKYNTSNYIDLDLATIESLNLKTHIFKILNYTITAQGYRLLKQNLLKPLKKLDLIQQRLQYTQYFYTEDNMRDEVRNILKNMTDIERELNNKANLLAIANNMQNIVKISKLLHNFTFQNINILNEISLKIINSIINEEVFTIDPNINSKLKELNKRYNDIEKKLEELSKEYFPNTNVKISKNNLIGIFIETPKKVTKDLHEKLILKHSTMSVNRYTSNDMILLEEELNRIIFDIKEEEKNIIEEYYNIIQENMQDIRININISAYIDLFSSYAIAAKELELSYPEIHENFDTKIINGFHLYLGKKSIYNSITFNKDKYNFVLTGPNMSGKSTFLRQIAITMILAQTGSFIPAEYGYLSLTDNIFSRIGASDDIEKGHSTFMVEMIETAAILNNATERSLLVLDEIGRGTSTKEGEVIACEILKYIHNQIKCKCIFATHYHDITQENLKHSTNLTIDILHLNNRIKFSYKIIEGYATNSYALHTAQIAGIPQSIIKYCQEKLSN